MCDFVLRTQLSSGISNCKYTFFVTAHGIAITQGPKIRFFAPQGQLVALILAKFVVEEWTGPLFQAKFCQNSCMVGA